MSRLNHVNFFRRWPVAVPTTSVVGVSLLTALAGCSSAPSRLEPANIDASGAASAAMTAYDKDGDGFVAGAELDGAPSLKASMETLDLNKDGKVDADEIVKRIEAWKASRVGVATLNCMVTLDGRPLPGALVTFEPEPFLGDALKKGDGETTNFGIASPTVAKENRVPADAPAGLAPGFYLVRITKSNNGSESIPARYNVETTLGQQVAKDDPAMANQRVKFELKSK